MLKSLKSLSVRGLKMLLLPLDEMKSRILEKLNIICEETDAASLNRVTNLLESQSNLSSLTRISCVGLWKSILMYLRELKMKLSSNDLFMPDSLAKVHSLLGGIEMNAGPNFSFKTFTTDTEALDYFAGFHMILKTFRGNQVSNGDIGLNIYRNGIFSKKIFAFQKYPEITRTNIFDLIKEYDPIPDPTKYLLQISDGTFCIDNELTIVASPELKLIYLDTIEIPFMPTNTIDINIIPIDDVQLTIFPYPIIVDMNERIAFHVELYHNNGAFKGKFVYVSKVSDFIAENVTEKAEMISLITSDEQSYELRVSGNRLVRQIEDDGEFVAELEYYKFMRFKIKLLPELGPLYDSLNVNLTETGDLQLNFLERHLKTLHSIFVQNRFYAPFSGLIQSSGFGKTKLCLDLLKKRPGIYCVFRGQGQSGVPSMDLWMSQLSTYIRGAKTDDLPSIFDMDKTSAVESTPGRFLIGLRCVLENYKKLFDENLQNNLPEEEFFKRIVLSFAEDPSSHVTNGRISLEFKPENWQKVTFKDVSSQISAILQTISHADYPFLLFLDELDNFYETKPLGRINGLNIVRRALHCLEPPTNLFVLAIGTNSDALDFTPAIRDNSLRFEKRNLLLPPFILSGNWDIFVTTVNYDQIRLNRSSLLNCAMLNVLFSLGRAIWSSCPLDKVMTLAHAKLRNGSQLSNGANLAFLMVRANLSVNVHHVLARTLVRSYMMVVNYVSTDSSNMKIGYSSEPVLAIAAREILKNLSSRIQAFLALKEFLIQRAVDKGRIVEAIFEHLVLFAVDDSTMSGLTMNDCPEAPEFPEDVQNKFTKCRTYLLTCQAKHEFGPLVIGPTTLSNTTIDPFKMEHYRVIELRGMLESLMNKQFQEFIQKIINPRTLDALIGSNHFIQLEKAKDEYFTGISNFPGEKSVRRKVIDKTLLKVGVLRQCGYTMPPNYYGIDFLVPIVIDRYNNPKADGIFSFIAVQSKSSMQDMVECAFKMSALFHLNRCPNENHETEFDCVKSGCKAFMSIADIKTILDDQVVILLSAKGSETRNLRTTVCLKGRKVPDKPAVVVAPPSEKDVEVMEEPPRRQSKRTKVTPATSSVPVTIERDTIVDDSFAVFRNEMEQFVANASERRNVESVSFPKYFDKIKSNLQPEIIITKNLNKLISVQKMVWLYTEGNLEEILNKGTEKSSKEEKGATKAKVKSNAAPSKHTLTCITVNDIKAFEHLVSLNGIALLREIIDFSTSNFQNVEKIHKPVVQNSMLNGIFSPYFEVNPMMQRFRGSTEDFPRLNDPLAEYEQNFDSISLLESIDASVLGSVNSNISGINPNYHQKFMEEFQKFDFENNFVQEAFEQDSGI